MKYSIRQLLGAMYVLSAVLAITFLSRESIPTSYSLQAWVAQNHKTPVIVHSAPRLASMDERIALRLQHRLRHQVSWIPSLRSLTTAIHQRQDLLKSALVVHVQRPLEKDELSWNASIAAHPLWLRFEVSLLDSSFIVDREKIAQDFSSDIASRFVAPIDVHLLAAQQSKAILRAETDGIAKEGTEIDVQLTAVRIADALEKGSQDLVVQATVRPGRITNETQQDLGDLTLLTTGRSNFKGSPLGRIANVQKALREHVHNTLVPPGATFSFNDTLGGPVDTSTGWYMAKVIINTDQLEMAPGGGICQASTTVYRAAVQAGFPIEKRRSHSLYVTYYAAHGVGIDATVYPGQQDLTFVNDSPGYLLIQAYDDGNDAYVNFYGTPDGREVALDGPFFTTNAPEELRIGNRDILANEIAWRQTVRHADGRQEQHVIVSRYKELPKGLKWQYGKTQGHLVVAQQSRSPEVVHGAAGLAGQAISQ